MDDGEWQPCDDKFQGAHSSTLTIPTVQKSSEGSYCCVVSNCAGEQTSKPANLSVGKNDRCWCTGTHCEEQQNHILYYTLLHVDFPLKPAGEWGKW